MKEKVFKDNKNLLKKIIVSILSVILIIGLFATNSLLVATASTQRIGDNEVITINTEDKIKTNSSKNYSKVTFIIDGKQESPLYIKNGNKITITATDPSETGVVIEGFTNGSEVNKAIEIQVTTYQYDSLITLNKSLSSVTADSDNEYTLEFAVGTSNITTVKSNAQKVVLILDHSLSMACDVSSDIDSDALADSYKSTRWYALKETVKNFAQEFLKQNPENKIVIVKYAAQAEIVNFNNTQYTNKYTNIESYIESVFTEKEYEDASEYYWIRNDVSNLNGYCNLLAGTNIVGSIMKTQELLGDNIEDTSVILLTDGLSNSYYQGGYFRSSSNYEKCSIQANEAGTRLKASGANIYSVALMTNDSDNVKIALGNQAKADGTSEYADVYMKTDSYDSLNKYFQNIITTITASIFQNPSVTDTLDSRFEIVPNQEGVTDNQNGTFTVEYKNLNKEQQVKKVKIRLKEEYAKTNNILGSAYTNNGCTFNATVEGTSYSKEFEQTPAAIVINPKNDSYTVNQNETLDGTGLMNNDGTIVSDNVKEVTKNVKKETNKTTENGGKVTIKEDGTFKYTPAKDFNGNDSFEYTLNLTVDGKLYSKTATVDIVVKPKYKVTIEYTIKYYKDGSEVVDDREVISCKVWNDAPDTVKVKAINTKNKYYGYKYSGEVLPATAKNGDVIEVKYVKDDKITTRTCYTVKHIVDGSERTADTAKYFSTAWVNASPKMIAIENDSITPKNYNGYKFKEIKNYQTAPKEVVSGTTLELIYEKDDTQQKDVSYTVKYITVQDNTETEVSSSKYENKVWINADTSINVTPESVTKKEIKGYKFDSYENYSESTTTVESGTVIKVKYIKDESQTKTISYTVEYYKGAIKVDEDTETHDTTRWINDSDNTIPVEAIDENKDYVGYKFSKTNPEELPEKIEAGSIIKVYYEKDNFGYTVIHHYGDKTEEIKGSDVEFESVLTSDAYTIQTYTGYKFDHDDIPEDGLVVSSDISKNVINVYYVKDEDQKHDISYKVEYYRDRTLAVTDIEIKSVWIFDTTLQVDKSKINTIDKFVGYKYDEATTGIIPEQVEDGSTIKIFYIKDEGQQHELTYTVEYYKDNIKDEAATQNIKENVWINDTRLTVKTSEINTTDKYEGYKFSKTEPEKIENQVTSGTIIKVYYEKDETVTKEMTYTVKYFKGDTEVEEDRQKVTKTVWINDKTMTVDVDNINVKDKYTGYVFKQSNPEVIPTEVEDNTEINIHYVKDLFSYTVEYYYNNVINTELTDVFKDIEFETEITTYTAKVANGYEFNRVEGLTEGKLTISEKPENNVIRVYYTTIPYEPDDEDTDEDEPKETQTAKAEIATLPAPQIAADMAQVNLVANKKTAEVAADETTVATSDTTNRQVYVIGLITALSVGVGTMFISKRKVNK